MRPSPAILLLALLAALLPAPAGAQDAGGTPLLVLEDDAGDVAVYAAGVDTAVPAGVWDAMDVVGLSVLETPAEFQMVLELVSLEATVQQNLLAAVQYDVVFRHNDAIYKVRSYVYDSTQAYARLERMPPGVDVDDGVGDFVADVPVAVDVATSTLALAVGRDFLVDGEGATPYPSRLLDLFMVDAGLLSGGTANVMGQPVPLPYLEDNMPDEGAGQVPVPVRFGISQEGQLRLGSREPFRFSNGEAGTFVFRVNATNLGSSEQVGEFVVVGAPQAWDVRVPGMVRLAGNETREFPVVVLTAFAHAHGSATSFTIELVGQDGLSTGRAQIGLRYPKIAQPAGHHNTVHLHNLDFADDPVEQVTGLVNHALTGYDFNKVPYFNTAEEDPADAGTPMSGYSCEGVRLLDDGDLAGTTYCWDAELSPALGMGLDFDLAATGTYRIPIHSLVLQPGARVAGQIVYYEPSEQLAGPYPYPIFLRDPIVVAELQPSDRAEIGLDGSHTFEGTIVPLEAGDYLPYQRGAGLALRLEMRTARPDNFLVGPRTEPELMPGGSMVLPLLEYKDASDEAYGVAGALHLTLEGDAHRLANPGDTLVYRVAVHNADAAAHDFAATILGSNRDWASVLGSDEFSIDADGSRSVTVVVAVPEDALDGDVADLVIEVASQEDVAVRALLRMVTTVDTDEEHPDDALQAADAAAQAAKDTPAPAVAWTALALLALVGALRRR